MAKAAEEAQKAVAVAKREVAKVNLAGKEPSQDRTSGDNKQSKSSKHSDMEVDNFWTIDITGVDKQGEEGGGEVGRAILVLVVM